MPSAALRLSCLLPGAHVVLDLLPGPTMPTLPGQAAGLLRAPVPIAEGVHGDEIQFDAQLFLLEADKKKHSLFNVILLLS